MKKNLEAGRLGPEFLEAGALIHTQCQVRAWSVEGTPLLEVKLPDKGYIQAGLRLLGDPGLNRSPDHDQQLPAPAPTS